MNVLENKFIEQSQYSVSLLFLFTVFMLFPKSALATCGAYPNVGTNDRVFNFKADGSGKIMNSTQASAGTSAEGMMVYDSTNNVLKYCDGTNWVVVPNDNSSQTSLNLAAIWPSSAGVGPSEIASNVGDFMGQYEWKQVAVGDRHTCAIRASDDQIFCWGYGANGRLGTNNGSTYLKPVSLSSTGGWDTTAWKSIVAGYSSTCAIRASDDQIFCWGSNYYKTLGNSSTSDRLVPTPLDSAGGWDTTAWSSLSTSALAKHVCAIRASDNRIFCWGTNTYGQLGNNSTTTSYVPTALDSSGGWDTTQWDSVSVAGYQTCALRSTDHYVFCWGKYYTDPSSGDHVPTALTSTSGWNTTAWKQVETSPYHTCAIRQSDEYLFCWGYGSYGQLGTGYTSNSWSPTSLDSGGGWDTTTWKSVSLFGGVTCAIRKTDNQLFCWGSNTNGQLGNNSTTNSSVPIPLDSSGNWDTTIWKSVAGGNGQTCAIRANDKHLFCWGNNDDGQLGINTTVSSLVPISLLVPSSTDWNTTTWKTLKVGGSFFCGIRNSDSRVFCWGSNTSGQLGNNTLVSSIEPHALDSSGGWDVTAWKDLSAGGSHVCAIRSIDDHIFCWGDNSYGKLGNNSTTSSPVPVPLDSTGGWDTTAWKKVYAGPNNHTCAIRLSDDHAFCWGYNYSGELGNNTTTNSYVPTALDSTGGWDTTAWKSLSVGNTFACGIRSSDDHIFCWGGGFHGVLGNNSTANSSTPVALDSTGGWDTTAWKSIISNTHSCAIRSSDDQLFCWGYNGSGQLGNNSTSDSSVPTPLDSSGGWDSISWKDVGLKNNSTCAVRLSDNKLFCWGNKANIDIASNTTSNTLVPVAIAPGSGWDDAAWSSIEGGNYGMAGIFSGYSTALPCTNDNFSGTYFEKQSLVIDLKANSSNQLFSRRKSLSNSTGPGLMAYSNQLGKLFYCDGTQWQRLSSVTSGSNCSSYPAGSAEAVIEWSPDTNGLVHISNTTTRTTPRKGSMIYNTTNKMLQLCDGTNWLNLNQPTPNSFTFTDQTGADLNTLYSSNIIQITGMSNDASASVSGEPSAEFRICSDSSCTSVKTAWSSSSATISDNDYLQVRLTSSSTSATTLSVNVHVGLGTDTWSVLTGDGTPNTFSFTDLTSQSSNSLILSNIIQISGISVSSPITVSGDGNPEFRICSDSACSSELSTWSTVANSINNNEYVQLRSTSSTADSTTTNVTLNIESTSDIWSITTGDNTPNSFAFTDLSGQFLSTLISSDILQISGITAPASITIAGDGSPQYRVCSDSSCTSEVSTWSSSSGSIINNQYIQIRTTSSSSQLTASNITLNIGSLSDSWSVTTGDDTPNAFTFSDSTGQTLSTLVTSNIVQITGNAVPATVTISGDGSPQYRTCSDSSCSSVVATWSSASGSISPDNYLQLRTTSSGTASTTSNVSINVSSVSDTWSVTTGNSTPNSFTFTDLTLQNISTLTNSEIIQITGNAVPATVTISGDGSPQYRICSDSSCTSVLSTWTSTSGSINSSEYIQLRTTTSAVQGATYNVVLYIDSAYDTWSLTTGDVTPNSFSFANLTTQSLSTTVSSAIKLISGISAPSTVSISGQGSPEFRICSDSACTSVISDWSATNTTISNIQYLQLRLTTASTSNTTYTSTVTVGTSSATWAATTGDSTPNTFSFTNQSGVNLSTQILSSKASIYSMNIPSPISITGDNSPEYRICSTSACSTVITDWTSSANTISTNQYVQLRVTSSSSDLTTFTATLDIGGVTADWSITTGDSTPNAFAFTDQIGTNLNSLIESDIIQISGINLSTLVSISGDASAEYRSCSDGYCSSASAWGTVATYINSGDYVQMRLTSSSTELTASTVTMTIGGVSDTWSVTSGTLPDGYLVLTNSVYDGNLGGIAGADALCLTELQTYDWKGKSFAGTLNSTRVKAFLCGTGGSSGCGQLTASSSFDFAVANNTTVGGARLSTDASGIGPGDSAYWNDSSHFGGGYLYWTAFEETVDTQNWSYNGAAGTSNNSYCSNWGSNSSSRTGIIGSSGGNDTSRWSAFSYAPDACNLTNRLLCIVNP